MIDKSESLPTFALCNHRITALRITRTASYPVWKNWNGDDVLFDEARNLFDHVVHIRRATASKDRLQFTGLFQFSYDGRLGGMSIDVEGLQPKVCHARQGRLQEVLGSFADRWPIPSPFVNPNSAICRFAIHPTTALRR